MNIEQLKFPIGPLKFPDKITQQHLDKALEVLAIFPEQLKLLTLSLSQIQLDSPYRPEGWTIRQLIHHIADSHHHFYNRLRWTLSEENPTIKAYNQDAYASLYDYTRAPITWSLDHIDILHKKIVYLYQSLTNQEWERTFIHPETKKEINLKQLVLTYAWHSMHHYAHIKNKVIAKN